MQTELFPVVLSTRHRLHRMYQGFITVVPVTDHALELQIAVQDLDIIVFTSNLLHVLYQLLPHKPCRDLPFPCRHEEPKPC